MWQMAGGSKEVKENTTFSSQIWGYYYLMLCPLKRVCLVRYKSAKLVCLFGRHHSVYKTFQSDVERLPNVLERIGKFQDIHLKKIILPRKSRIFCSFMDIAIMLIDATATAQTIRAFASHIRKVGCLYPSRKRPRS